jgi:hypothetical protein
MNYPKLKRLLISVGALALISRLVPVAYADPTDYNANITAIYGTGNGSTGWTADVDPTDGLTLGLQAKVRATGATNSDDAGTYTFEAGADGSGRALWSFQFSIYDAAGLNSGDTFSLTLNSDTSAGDTSVTINPLILDDSFGTLATPASGGSTTYSVDDTVAQNSENIGFAFIGGNPNLTGTYDLVLDAYSQGVEVASTSITVNVVPDTTNTLLLAGLAFGCLMVSARRFRSVKAV